MLWCIAIVAAIAWLAVFVFLAGFLPAPDSAHGAQAPASDQRVRDVEPCGKISAKRWNQLVSIERKLDGSSGNRTRRKTPVCSSEYRDFKAHVKRVRADCLRKVKISGASFYGYADSGGIIGACQKHLGVLHRAGVHTFAVLRSGNVTSKCWQGFYFQGPNGNVIYAVQADTGSGGDNVGPYPRTFDFFATAATEIGITRSMGTAPVKYSKRNCWAH